MSPFLIRKSIRKKNEWNGDRELSRKRQDTNMKLFVDTEKENCHVSVAFWIIESTILHKIIILARMDGENGVERAKKKWTC
jgi:hypothetical protein